VVDTEMGFGCAASTAGAAHARNSPSPRRKRHNMVVPPCHISQAGVDQEPSRAGCAEDVAGLGRKRSGRGVLPGDFAIADWIRLHRWYRQSN